MDTLYKVLTSDWIAVAALIIITLLALGSLGLSAG